MLSSKDTIEFWLGHVKSDMITSYVQKGLKASGKWEQSLETKVSETSTGYEAVITGQKYTGAMLYGRSANTNQSPESIKAWIGWAGSTFIAQWVKDKGLNLNPYAVAGKIAKKGIKVPNQYNDGEFLKDVINDERIKELGKDLGKEMLNNVSSDVIKDFANGNK